jgi:hypothetical protein
MIAIPLATLERVAAHKPAGYKAACLAAGTVENGVLHLDETAFAALRNRFTTPSLAKQALSLGRAVVNECRGIAEGVEPVSDGVKAARLAVCAGCEFFIAAENRCSKCGCKLDAKAAMRTQSCPLGKWPQLTADHGREALRQPGPTSTDRGTRTHQSGQRPAVQTRGRKQA